MRRMILCIARIWIGLLAGLLGMATSHGAATIAVVNNDGPNEGFNDPTPFTPVGNNNAVTLGQARLDAFQYAANLWGTCINSNVLIVVRAQMDPQSCTPTIATLGSAGAVTVHRDFTNAPIANTWYPQALANALVGADLDPANSDINATFNSNLNGNPSCLGGRSWYYGFDRNPGLNETDFITVVLHEIGHGLGFATQVALVTGVRFMGRDDSYMRFLEQAGATPSMYPAMTDAQRVAASISDPNLRWTGASATAAHSVIPITAGLNGGFLRNHAPNPQAPGSSVSHWSTALTPNELMEPSYTGPDHDPSLAIYLLRDIGWNLDGTPPSITCPQDITVECTAGGGTPATDPIIVAFLNGATTSAGCCEVTVTDDASAFFSLGTTTVTFTGTDGANVMAHCTADVTVIDATPPNITCPPNITVECSAHDGTPRNDPQLTSFFGGVSASDTCDPSLIITSDATPLLPLGVTTVTFTARDATGNDSFCTADVHVVDTNPPTIAVSLNPLVLSPANGFLRLVTATVNATDVCSVPTVALDLIFSNSSTHGIAYADFGTPDFSFFLRAQLPSASTLRIYGVFYSATDSSGNRTTAKSNVYALPRR